MAKDIKESPKEIKPEQQIVSAKDSEGLQKQGWVVVGMSRKDGQRVHILEKR